MRTRFDILHLMLVGLVCCALWPLKVNADEATNKTTAIFKNGYRPPISEPCVLVQLRDALTLNELNTKDLFVLQSPPGVLSEYDIISLPTFIKALQDKSNPVSQYLLAHIGASINDPMSAYLANPYDVNRQKALTAILVKALNKIITEGQSFADEPAFKGISSADIENLKAKIKAAKPKNDLDVIWLNRLLITSAYPAALSHQISTQQLNAQQVTITNVTPIGLPDDQGKYQEVALSGTFLPATVYYLTVNYATNAETIKVADLPNKNDGKIFGVFGTSTNSPTHLTVSPLATSSAATGFQYDIALGLPTRGDFDYMLSSRGEISFGSKTNKLLQALNLGANVVYHNTAYGPSKEPIPVGIVLKPVDMEATQDFKTVDYTAQLQAYAAKVPFSDYPQMWYRNAVHLDGNGLYSFVTVSTGYTFAYEVSGTNNPANGTTTHRWDSEIKYGFWIANPLQFQLTYSSYAGLSKSFYKDTLDMKLTYFFNTSTNTGFFIGYLQGSAPPAFTPVSSSFRFGVTGKL